MLPDDHRHGTYAGGQAHLREHTQMCEPCHQAHLRYRRRRSYDAAAGKSRNVPTGPVVEHLHRLRARGVSVRAIAAESGASDSLIDELLNRPRKVMRRDNADAILGTHPSSQPHGYVSSTGTLRRIRALGRLGWSMPQIVEASGGRVKTFALRSASCYDPPTVRYSTREAIADVYERLSMTIPPAGRTASQVRTRAIRKGWPPPLAWNDIDDPDEEPAPEYRQARSRVGAGQDPEDIDDVVVDRILAGDWKIPSTVAEKRAVVDRWQGTYGELESLTGWKVERYIDRQAVA